MAEQKNGTTTRWAIGIIVSILFALIMGAYALAGNAMGKATASETDIGWIKSSLERIETNLGIK